MPEYSFYRSKSIEKCIDCPMLALNFITGAKQDYCELNSDLDINRGSKRPLSCPLRVVSEDIRHKIFEEYTEVLN